MKAKDNEFIPKVNDVVVLKDFEGGDTEGTITVIRGIVTKSIVLVATKKSGAEGVIHENVKMRNVFLASVDSIRRATPVEELHYKLKRQKTCHVSKIKK